MYQVLPTLAHYWSFSERLHLTRLSRCSTMVNHRVPDGGATVTDAWASRAWFLQACQCCHMAGRQQSNGQSEETAVTAPHSARQSALRTPGGEWGGASHVTLGVASVPVGQHATAWSEPEVPGCINHTYKCLQDKPFRDTA